jgi:hypothetical protein
MKLMSKLMGSFNLLKDVVITETEPVKPQIEQMTDELIIFNEILSEIIVYLKQQYAEDVPLFKQYLLEEIPELGLPPDTLETLLMWCRFIDSDSLVIHRELSQQQMSEFINLLYEALCSLLGAKQADLLL